MKPSRMIISLAFAVLAPVACFAESTSDIDKAFVAKVSQGGMYEVEASKVAVQQATAADVKDLATTEVHDHDGVNKALKSLAQQAGITISADLNDDFKSRLLKLTTMPRADFDAAYLKDMESIHDKDEKLFAQEAKEGSEPFKAFAQETDKIVKRHIGALHGTD